MTWAEKYPHQRLVPVDPAWVTRYLEYEVLLKAHLGPAWQVEHVGSTSVPGLLAKPVIDIALGMPEGASRGEAGDCLASIHRWAGGGRPVRARGLMFGWGRG